MLKESMQLDAEGVVRMSDDRRRSQPEKRDTNPEGLTRRAQFNGSLDLLRSLGLSLRAMEHYRLLARKIHKLPHALVRDLAEESISSPS